MLQQRLQQFAQQPQNQLSAQLPSQQATLQQLSHQPELQSYTRVLLSGLMKNFELNGQYGFILPQECSMFPMVPGCLKVKLESGQEVAVKPMNVKAVPVLPSLVH